MKPNHEAASRNGAPKAQAAPAASVTPGVILEFDATARRREKMRQKGITPSAATTAAPTPARPADNGHAHAAPVERPTVLPASRPLPVTPRVVTPPKPVAPPAPVVPPPVVAESAVSLDPAELEKFLVNFVVEHTGYPAEIVELDADLEADLGIDSIKKAQLFGELGEYFDVQPTADLSLDSFPTLRHVLDFLVKVQGSAPPAAPAPSTNGSMPAAAPVVQAPAVQVPAAESAVSLDPAELETFLVNFVVEHTGYPAEIVELDADLEADLGIDSIKKAQLFGELGEYFDVQPTADLSLDSFPTLRHVLDFLVKVQGSAPSAAPAPSTNGSVPAAAPVVQAPAVQVPAAESAVSLDPAELEKFLVNFVVEHTGYPAEIVELDADLEADLGIDSIKKAQLFGELGEYFDVQPTADLSLDSFPTLRHVLDFLVKVQGSTSAAPAPVAPAVTATPVALATAVAASPVAVASAVESTASLDPAELEKFLVNFVVEHTGYPAEIVELDADLEADLGIDSIKKAQLFGELGEYFDVQPSADLSLDSFPTLRHVLDYLLQNANR